MTDSGAGRLGHNLVGHVLHLRRVCQDVKPELLQRVLVSEHELTHEHCLELMFQRLQLRGEILLRHPVS